MSNLKPNTNELAQVVVDKLNNTCQKIKNKCFECKNLTFKQLVISEKGYQTTNFCRVKNKAIIDCVEYVKEGCQDFECVANVSKTIRSYQDQTLIDALKILANDIQSEDGVANSCIYEASQRLEQLT